MPDETTVDEVREVWSLLRPTKLTTSTRKPIISKTLRHPLRQPLSLVATTTSLFGQDAVRRDHGALIWPQKSGIICNSLSLFRQESSLTNDSSRACRKLASALSRASLAVRMWWATAEAHSVNALSCSRVFDIATLHDLSAIRSAAHQWNT